MNAYERERERARLYARNRRIRDIAEHNLNGRSYFRKCPCDTCSRSRSERQRNRVVLPDHVVVSLILEGSRPSNATEIDRRTAVDYLIKNRPYLNARQIAEQCGVTTRTVQRRRSALRAQGVAA